MRKMFAAPQTSVDGFIEGLTRELDWAMASDDEMWEEVHESLKSVDTCILGRVMYPGYEQYWLGLLANPAAGSKNEIAYARWADKTPHIVISKTLDKVAWKTTRIVREVEEIRKLKQQPGNDMYVVGGATVVGSLMNHGLIDELRLMVNPIVLGGGKALFKDVKDWHALKLVRTKSIKSGKVSLAYNT